MVRALQTRVAVAAFAGMIISSPSVLSINSLMLSPIATEFGWDRSTVSAGYMIAAPVMAGMYLLIGPAIDRFGVRYILVPGVLLFAGTIAATSLLTGNIGQYLLIKALTAAAASLVTGIAFGKVISGAFATHRGLLLGLCLGGGGGLGMTLLPMIGGAIFVEHGWRGAYLGMALIVLLIGLPAALSLPREDKVAASPSVSEPRFSSDAAGMRGGLFKAVLVMTFAAYSILNGVFAHLAAIATEQGISATGGARALAAYAAALTVSQFLVGMVLDRTKTPRVAAVMLAAASAGTLLLRDVADPLSFGLCAAMIGLGTGTVSGLLPFIVPRFFGMASFATLYAWIYAAAALGTGVGPFGLGVAYDQYGSYGPALLLYVAGAALVTAMVAALPRYRFSSRGERIGIDRTPTRTDVITTATMRSDAG